MFRRVVVAVCAVAVLSSCASDPAPAAEQVECDRDDLAERDPDCGYWDSSGVWWWWYWVNPSTGGVSPYGWRPVLPAGASTRKPGNANPGASRQPTPNPPAGTAARPPVGTVRQPAPRLPANPPKVNQPVPPRPAPPPARPR